MFPANKQDFSAGEGMSEFVTYGTLWKNLGWLSEKEDKAQQDKFFDELQGKVHKTAKVLREEARAEAHAQTTGDVTETFAWRPSASTRSLGVQASCARRASRGIQTADGAGTAFSAGPIGKPTEAPTDKRKDKST